MTQRKLVVILATAVIIVVAFAGFMKINEMKRPSHLPDEQTGQQPQPTLTPPALKPAISTYMHEISGYWTRDSSNDLPVYITTLGFDIKNFGNANAENVGVTIKVSETTYKQHTILQLAPYQQYTDTFTVTVAYDKTIIAYLFASCSESSDSTTLSIKASLPRNLTTSVSKLFITPNEANVVSIKNQILSSKFLLTPDWIALKDWVATNIKYPPDDADGDGIPDYDYIKHGKWEYWQLPKETLQLRTGDCEDYSILLVSLLRAAGWSPNDVYVVLGKNSEGKGHAWVKIRINLLIGSVWYNLEPQVGGWNVFDVAFDIWKCSGYQAECYFNDSQFHTL